MTLTPDSEPGANEPMLYRITPKFGNQFRQYAAAISASLGPFCGGTVLSWSSAALEFVTEDTSNNSTNTTNILSQPGFAISGESVSLVASILTIGALVSALPTGYLADKFGRKPIMLGLALSFLLGWLLIALAHNLDMLLAGRFFAGIGLGGVCVTSPMYVIEIAESKRRGTLGSFFNLFLISGILFTNILGACASWLGLSIPLAVISIIFGVSFFFVPESPVYLVKKGRLHEAEQNLRYLRGSKFDVVAELELIEKEIKESSVKTASTRDIITNKGYLRAAICAVGIMAFQQLCGINAIFFYAVQLFKAAGSTISANLCAIIMCLVQFIVAYFALFFIDKAGRKFYLTLSSIGMMMGLMFLAVFFHLQSFEISLSGISFLPILGAVIFAISFSLGYGPIPFMLIHELLAPEIRGLTSGFAIVVNWSMAFLVTHCYPIMTQNIGMYATYYIFAGIVAVGTLFVYFVVPETRGISFKEISDILSR